MNQYPLIKDRQLRTIMLEDKLLNIVRTYAPQVGCKEIQKEEFWQNMDEEMQRIPGIEDIMILDDMTRHKDSYRL